MDGLRGVNLAGWLMLESWVTPEIFAATGALTEQGLIDVLGTDAYLKLIQAHRRSFITSLDFKALKSRGFNAVRIQVPWYVFGQEGPLPGIHESCIDCLDDAFRWADELDIDIVLDLSLVPDARTTPDGLAMYTELAPQQRAAILQVLSMLADRYMDRPSFLGIEPLGQVSPQVRRGFTVTPGVPLHRLRSFYRDAYHAIREAAGDDCVVILNDAGVPSKWKWFMAQHAYENVWLDTHLYYFTNTRDVTGPAGIQRLAHKSKAALAAASASGLPVVVGEWSAALPLADSSVTPEGRIALERLFVAGQLAAFENTRGWFFQTWKTSGRISGWDSRIALSSFERDILD